MPDKQVASPEGKTELSIKVHDIMAREMGHLGKFIVSKQCKDLGINVDNIAAEHIQALAKALGNVMMSFGGEEKARKIEAEIRKLVPVQASEAPPART